MSHVSDLISEDILAYLGQHERKEMLRFLTCGNVDDGKSTLIGRLLHDSKMIYEDHLEAITRDSKKSGTTGDDIDLALLVDGLQAEREQGITSELVAMQTKIALGGVSAEELKRVIIAYEPVWAIGTGKTATAEQANEVCHTIREVICELYGKASDLCILFGCIFSGLCRACDDRIVCSWYCYGNYHGPFV